MNELNDWRALRFLNLYRTVLSGLLVTLNSLPSLEMLRALWAPDLFSVCALLYLVLAVGFSFTIHRRAMPRQTQFQLQILIDLVALTLLGFAAGNTTLFFSLMLVPVTFAGFWQPGLITQGYAVLAIVLMLAVALVHPLLALPGYSYVELGALAAAQLSVGLISALARHRDADAHAREREQELALANLTELNGYIVQRIDEGVVIVDGDNRIRLFNPAAGEMLALSAERPLPQPLQQVSAVLPDAVQAWRQGQPLPTALPWRLQITTLGSERNGLVMLLLEDRRAQDNRLQKAKLEALGRLTASLAHEIRNPLAAVSQSAQLLAESTQLQPEDQQLLTILLNQSRRLNRMVDDILTLSRRKTPDWQELELGVWLDALMAEWALSWPQLAAILVCRLDLDEGETLQVRVDPLHLRQLLTILLDNALRHAQPPPGTPLQLKLRLSRLAPAQTPCIEVCDNGQGIAPELAQQIYEPFFSTHANGTGLGLYVAKELCEANYCELSYIAPDSCAPGGGFRGGCFRVTFPMERPLISPTGQ